MNPGSQKTFGVLFLLRASWLGFIHTFLEFLVGAGAFVFALGGVKGTAEGNVQAVNVIDGV